MSLLDPIYLICTSHDKIDKDKYKQLLADIRQFAKDNPNISSLAMTVSDETHRTDNTDTYRCVDPWQIVNDVGNIKYTIIKKRT